MTSPDPGRLRGWLVLHREEGCLAPGLQDPDCPGAAFFARDRLPPAPRPGEEGPVGYFLWFLAKELPPLWFDAVLASAPTFPAIPDLDSPLAEIARFFGTPPPPPRLAAVPLRELALARKTAEAPLEGFLEETVREVGLHLGPVRIELSRQAAARIGLAPSDPAH